MDIYRLNKTWTLLTTTTKIHFGRPYSSRPKVTIFENVWFSPTKPQEIATEETSALTLLIRFNAIFFESYYAMKNWKKW